MHPIRSILRSCALAAGLLPTIAHADAPPDAIALFDQGLKDLEAGNTAVACRELAASLAKYSDSGTKGALAECYTRLGKVVSAWNLWKDLGDTAPADMRAEALANASKLEPRLPRYIIKLAGTPPAGLVVKINTVAVADPTLAVPLPVDPGPITATASAPDHKPWSKEFQASEGKVTTIEVPTLVALPPSATTPTPTPTPTPPVTGGTVAAPLRLVEGDDSARRTRHVIGGSVMLVGVAALGIGGYFGSAASSKWSDAKMACGGDVSQCSPGATPVAQPLLDDARSAALRSTIMFGIGGAAVVVGAIVWLSAPAAEHRIALAPAIGTHSAGLALSGSF